MGRSVTACLVFSLLTIAMPSAAESEDRRIARLEAQLAQQKKALEQQQRMLEAMEAELASLRSGEDALQVSEPASGAETAVEVATRADEPVVDFGRTSAAWYGHVQLDNIYDFKAVDPDYESTLRPSTIPTQSGEFGSDGNVIVSAKQTLFGFHAETPTRMGVVKTWFEFDLFGTGGDAGKTTFDFRHGWVQLGGLGFGQTNSNFMDISIFPNVVDWWGPSGMVFNRNPQVRYTWKLDQSEFAVALEKPNGSFNTGIFGEISPEFGAAAKDDTPLWDLTAHYRSVHPWGHVQLAGVLRKLAFETRGTPGNNPSGDVTGWGFNLTSVINSFGRDQLKLGLVYGEGIASFMNDGGVNLAPENFNARAVPVLGVTAYYDRYWSDRWSSSVGISVNDNDPRDQQADFEFHRGTYASTNLLFSPVPEMLFGLEFLFGQHEDVGGRTGRDYRTQFTMKHKLTGGRW